MTITPKAETRTPGEIAITEDIAARNIPALSGSGLAVGGAVALALHSPAALATGQIPAMSGSGSATGGLPPSNFLHMTESQRANAPPLEPALNTLLRDSHEEMVTTLRVQDITDRETFVALDSTDAVFRQACFQGFRIDLDHDFPHRRALGRLFQDLALGARMPRHQTPRRRNRESARETSFR